MATAGAAAAAIAQATKASGVIIHLEPEEFQRVLYRTENAVVVIAPATGKMFSRKHQYLTSYRGLAFYTDTPDRLHMPSGAEVVAAKKIWVP